MKLIIDTIRFAVPLTKELLRRVKDKRLYTSSFKKRLDDFSNESYRGEYLTPAQKILTWKVEKQYDRKIKEYTYYLDFEFSLPKFFWGTNVFELVDWHPMLKVYTEEKIAAEIINGLPPLEEWIIKRLDLCRNYTLDTIDDVITTLQYLSVLTTPYCRSTINRSSEGVIETVTFQSTVGKISFYQKFAEFMKKPRKKNNKTILGDYDRFTEEYCAEAVAEELKNIAKTILRAEVTIRPPKLKNLAEKLGCPVKSTNELTVVKILELEHKGLWQVGFVEPIEKIFGQLPTTPITEEQLFDFIKKNVDEQRLHSFFTFITLWMNCGIKFCEKHFKPATFSNYKKLARKLKVPLILTERKLPIEMIFPRYFDLILSSTIAPSKNNIETVNLLKGRVTFTLYPEIDTPSQDNV